MLNDITNVSIFGSTPRSLCADLLKGYVGTPHGSPRPEKSPAAKSFGSGGGSAKASKQLFTPMAPRAPDFGMPSPTASAGEARLMQSPPASAAARRVAMFDEARAAVRDVLAAEGMDSDWTSQLSSRLEAAGDEGGELQSILGAHGWAGGQFSSPPDRQLLLSDLERAARAGAKRRSRRGGA